MPNPVAPDNDTVAPVAVTPRERVIADRARIRSELIQLVEARSDRPEPVDELTSDEIETHARLAAAWTRSETDLAAIDAADDQARIDDEIETLYAAPSSRRLQAAVDVDCITTIAAIGANNYRAEQAPLRGSANSFELPQPYISRDSDGRNRVHAHGVLFAPDGQVDEDATERSVELLLAGRAGEYDPHTGAARVDAAVVTTTDSTYSGSIPTPAVELYRYLLAQSVIAQYVDIRQTEMTVGDLPITRKTAIPTAIVLGTRTNAGQGQTISDSSPTYSSVTLNALKFGFMTRYSYEHQASITPWDFAMEVVADGGEALGNALGKQLVVGDGLTTAMEGIKTAVEASATQQVAGAARVADAFAGTKLFDIAEYLKLYKAVAAPIHAAGNVRLLVSFSVFVDMLGVQDPVGGSAFFGANGFLARDRVIIENEMPGLVSAKVAMILGDFSGHTLRLAGGTRMEYSTEYGFATDTLGYRFLQHADAKQVDTTKMRGYLVKAT